MNRVGEQITIAARADQGNAATIGEKTSQHQREYQQSIVPECADVIFSYRSAENARAIVNFVTQCTLPNPQQTNSERDQPPRNPAFDLQLFLRDIFADARSSPQRYAREFGNPIWSRIRQTTVSTIAVTEFGRL